MSPANPFAVYLTPAEVAARYHGSAKTLANWRSAGRGPPYHKVGARVLYLLAELEAWEAEVAATPLTVR